MRFESIDEINTESNQVLMSKAEKDYLACFEDWIGISVFHREGMKGIKLQTNSPYFLHSSIFSKKSFDRFCIVFCYRRPTYSALTSIIYLLYISRELGFKK